MRADLCTLMHMKIEDSMVIVLIFKLYQSLCAYVSRKEHQSIMLFCFSVHSKHSSRKKRIEQNIPNTHKLICKQARDRK